MYSSSNLQNAVQDGHKAALVWPNSPFWVAIRILILNVRRSMYLPDIPSTTKVCAKYLPRNYRHCTNWNKWLYSWSVGSPSIRILPTINHLIVNAKLERRYHKKLGGGIIRYYLFVICWCILCTPRHSLASNAQQLVFQGLLNAPHMHAAHIFLNLSISQKCSFDGEN